MFVDRLPDSRGAVLAAKAHARAQRRWHTMLVARCYGDPTDRRTRLVTEAERLVDRLNAQAPEWFLDAAHEAALAELDELRDQEYAHLFTDAPLAAWAPGEITEAWGR